MSSEVEISLWRTADHTDDADEMARIPFRGAHPSRLLVSASRRNSLSSIMKRYRKRIFRQNWQNRAGYWFWSRGCGTVHSV